MVLDLMIIGLAITLEPLTIVALILILAAEKGTRKGLAFIPGWLACLVVVIAAVAPTELDESGFGFVLVDALAATWGCGRRRRARPYGRNWTARNPARRETGIALGPRVPEPGGCWLLNRGRDAGLPLAGLVRRACHRRSWPADSAFSASDGPASPFTLLGGCHAGPRAVESRGRR